MGETERVMFLMLWGIKCKQINGTDFLHTSVNTIFFRSANMKTLSSLPLKNMCLSVRNKLLNFFFPFLIPFLLLESVIFCCCCCLVEGLREGNGGSLQTM